MEYNHVQTLERLIRLGLQPLAIEPNSKKPLHKGWTKETIALARILKYNTDRFGLRMGDKSFMCFDIDSKHHENPKWMLDTYYKMLEDQGFDFNDVIRQTTMNGGGHIIYRSVAPVGSTDISRNRSGETLFETRGVGAQIVMYEMEKFDNIADLPILSKEKEKMLFETAKAFDQNLDTPKNVFQEFNSKISCADILRDNGWSYVKEDDSKIYMLRDGDTTSKTSAHIFKDSNKLWVWSTSTPLEPQKAYSAADLTIKLCYNGDKKAFAKDQKSKFNSSAGYPNWFSTPSSGFFNETYVTDLVEHAKKDPPKKLLGSFWCEGEVCFLFASTNVGKSAFSFRVADCIAKGFSMNEEHLKNECSAMKILYIDFELSPRQLGTRLSEKLVSSKNLVVMQPSGDAEIGESVVLKAIENSITKHKAKAIVVDNISAINTDNESALEAGKLMKNLKNIARKYHLSMLIVAHTPKRDQNEKIELKHLAGSAQLSNLADSVVGMGKSNQNHGDRYIKQLKVRSFELEYHDENVLLMNLDMLDTGLGFTIKDTANERDLVNTMVDRSERNQEIIQLSYKGYSGGMIAEKLGMGKSQVNAIIKRHKDGKEE